MNKRIQMGAKELVELGRKCGPGKILRSGFTRSDGTYVKPSCVKDQGAPGKTPSAKRVLPKPKEGTLRGWSSDDSAKTRHQALKKAVKTEGCRSVILRLNLEANFTKKTSPKTYRAARQDMEYLRGQNWCALKTKK